MRQGSTAEPAGYGCPCRPFLRNSPRPGQCADLLLSPVETFSKKGLPGFCDPMRSGWGWWVGSYGKAVEIDSYPCGARQRDDPSPHSGSFRKGRPVELLHKKTHCLTGLPLSPHQHQFHGLNKPGSFKPVEIHAARKVGRVEHDRLVPRFLLFVHQHRHLTPHQI